MAVPTTVDYQSILTYVPPAGGIDKVAIHINTHDLSNRKSLEVRNVVIDADSVVFTRDLLNTPPTTGWHPKTHLRDSEIMDGDRVIERWQGVGVLVIPHWKSYLKLIFTKNFLLDQATYFTYRDNDHLAFLVSHDLTQGWDVLMVKADGSVRSYCEPKDWRDQQ